MVSNGLVATCLALSASRACGFVSSFAPRASFGAQVTGRAPSAARQSVARRGGDLSMRVSPKFVVSKKARDEIIDGTAATTITVDMKSCEVVKEATTAKETRAQIEAQNPITGPGMMTPNMEMFCKAAADGSALGDCPFTHYIQMVLHYKDLPFKLSPCSPDTKPKWLVEDYEGQMPCLVDNGEAYTESDEIVEYIEYFYPEPTLSLKDTPEKMAKAKEVTKGVFGALARCVKNLEAGNDHDLVSEVMEELKKVDAHLADTKGPFLTGEQMTLADCSFAPKLYHASTCLAHFKNTVIPPELESLHKYMDMIYSHDAFVKSTYPPDIVVWGWNKARGTDAK